MSVYNLYRAYTFLVIKMIKLSTWPVIELGFHYFQLYTYTLITIEAFARMLETFCYVLKHSGSCSRSIQIEFDEFLLLEQVSHFFPRLVKELPLSHQWRSTNLIFLFWVNYKSWTNCRAQLKNGIETYMHFSGENREELYTILWTVL